MADGEPEHEHVETEALREEALEAVEGARTAAVLTDDGDGISAYLLGDPDDSAADEERLARALFQLAARLDSTREEPDR